MSRVCTAPGSSSTTRTSSRPAVAAAPSARSYDDRGQSPHSLRYKESVDPYELLTRELGSARVLRTPEALDAYGRDESGRGFYPPDAAVLCESRAEIELVLRLAAEHKIPVTPRGAGSGMTGGA